MKIIPSLAIAIFFFLESVLGLRYNYGDGSFYVGAVDERGRPSGRGRFCNTDGKLEYEGDFLNGVPHGNGTRYGVNGDILEGEFKFGEANGHAVLRYKNGDRLEGSFVKNLPDGLVSIVRVDGERIQGEFRHGMPHGRVVWKLKNGHRMDGVFRMGRPHGYVRVSDGEGNEIFHGKFIHGRPVKPMPKEVNLENFIFEAPKMTTSA